MMASKTANLYARIEPGLKEEAEGILAELGIPASNAITMFYKQIVLHKGLPFVVTLSIPARVNYSELDEREFDRELAKGYNDMLEGRTKTARNVFEEIRKDYGL